MCLTLEGRVVDVKGKSAMVDFGGTMRKVSAEFLKPKPEDRVTVFNDFIIEIIKG